MLPAVIHPLERAVERTAPEQARKLVPAKLPLTIHLDPESDHPARRYGLAELCLMLGAPCDFQTGDRPAIYVGHDPRIGDRAAVWIAPSAIEDWRVRPPTLTHCGGIAILGHGAAPKAPLRGHRVEFDLCLATTYWLSLQGETAAKRRDPHGRLPSYESPATRAAGAAADVPPIHGYQRLLSQLLWGDVPPAGHIPAWPHGKRFAIAFTHDVDCPERSMLARRLVPELIWPRSISRRSAYYALRAEVAARGAWECLLAGPEQRMEWDFADWCGLEAAHGFRSAYFFAPVRRDRGHAYDVDYDVRRRRYRRLQGRLITAGFEVGLHAGYASRWGRPPLEEQIRLVGARGAHDVQGVRHHYLQIDHDDPMSSLAQHASAGLRYDSSIGFNDAPGFRAGVALPYRPWHPLHGRLDQFVELSMSIADMHLAECSPAEASERVAAHLRLVRSVCGLGVLNWHVGHWRSHPAWRAAYIAACETLARDDSAWIATPAEIARWWLDRAARCAAGAV